MASDLKFCGYKRLDVLRIYGFNLVLLPVNLAGVGNSIVQAITGEKSVFGRTPKVRDRTIPNLMFIVSPYCSSAWPLSRWSATTGTSAGTTWSTPASTRCWRSTPSWRSSACATRWSTLVVQLKARLYKPEKAVRATVSSPASIVANPPAVDWASVLHFGGLDAPRLPKAAANRALGQLASAPPFADDLDLGAALAVPSSSMIHPEVAFRTVFQPILDLATSGIVGYEALTRFEDGVSPDDWLADATARGAGVELEILLARAGIQAADLLPPGVWLSINVSLNLIRAGNALRNIIEGHKPDRARDRFCLDSQHHSLAGRSCRSS